jgi:hypothetical protein
MPGQEDNLKYPIGKFKPGKEISPQKRSELINEIAETPDMLRKTVTGLNGKQLDTPYRPGG